MKQFESGLLKVRKLEKKDNKYLAKWLSDPSVLEYYEGRDNPFDLDKVNRVFYPPNDKEEVKGIVEYSNRAIGYIQFYPLDSEAKKLYGYSTYSKELIYGTDQFIGEVAYWNKGIGEMLVSSMIHFLIENQKADRVVMDPQTRNVRAIKCYEKCGLKKVKILAKRELHEGEYQDCWLMEYRK